MMDDTCASVNRLRCVHYAAAEDVAHALKAEAHAEDRNCRFQKNAPADSEVPLVFGTPRSGRKDDVVRSESRSCSQVSSLLRITIGACP
jgi:hypothetical protein